MSPWVDGYNALDPSFSGRIVLCLDPKQYLKVKKVQSLIKLFYFHVPFIQKYQNYIITRGLTRFSMSLSLALPRLGHLHISRQRFMLISKTNSQSAVSAETYYCSVCKQGEHSLEDYPHYGNNQAFVRNIVRYWLLGESAWNRTLPYRNSGSNTIS